ncbi:MAG: hypothetical protein FWG06_00295 [Clostridiales bacterium]|nr:hypothetical protein [Clostridiales bacterium]
MSLRGIDAQIMVAKSTEVTGEHARLVKQSEKTAEHAALQAQRQAVIDRSRTQAADQAKGGKITPEGRGTGGFASGGNPRERREGQPDGAPDDDLLSLPVEPEKPRIIDITI